MSCLFDSLSKFIINKYTNKSTSSIELRQLICDHLEKNPKLIEGLDLDQITMFDSNMKPNEYINNMRNPSSWGGSIEIKTFCEIFNVSVIVKYNGKHIEFKSSKPKPNGVIYIKYTGSHYIPLKIIN